MNNFSRYTAASGLDIVIVLFMIWLVLAVKEYNSIALVLCVPLLILGVRAMRRLQRMNL